jgi:hypothetical protein
MSQFQTITVNDSTATPTAFSPVSNINGVANWRATSGVSVGVSAPKVSMSLRPGKMGNAVTLQGRVKRKVTVKMQQMFTTGYNGDAGNPLYDSVELELKIAVPENIQIANLADENIIAFIVGLLADAQFSKAIHEGEFVY